MRNSSIHRAARLLLVLAVLATAGCAATGTPSQRVSAPLPGSDACVFMSSVFDWDVVDPTTLIVYAPMRKDAYLLKLFEPVVELQFKNRVGFEDADHNGMLCGSGDYLLVRDEIAPRRVPIVAFRKITTEQAQLLLPAATRPADKAAVAAPATGDH
jgi:hypothetical protein